MKLAEAQQSRRTRREEILDARTDALLDEVGLSEAEVERIALGTENVSPEDRDKLKGIISRLRGKKHTFTTCLNDLRRNKPQWSEERRKKTCGTLKALAKPGGQMAAGNCPSIELDDGVAELLLRADASKLES